MLSRNLAADFYTTIVRAADATPSIKVFELRSFVEKYQDTKTNRDQMIVDAALILLAAASEESTIETKVGLLTHDRDRGRALLQTWRAKVRLGAQIKLHPGEEHRAVSAALKRGECGWCGAVLIESKCRRCPWDWQWIVSARAVKELFRILERVDA